MPGFGGKSINCTQDQAQVVQHLLSILVANTTAKDVNEAYAKCLEMYEVIGQMLPIAFDSWSKTNYSDSAVQVRAVVDTHYKCVDLIVGFSNPPELDHDLYKFRCLSTAAIDVINQIH